jgi:flagellar biosynthesis/type III secretory pathway protein FliH
MMGHNRDSTRLSANGTKCHTFPALNDDAFGISARRNNESEGAFTTLFRSSHQSPQALATDANQDAADQVRQEKFQQGFDAGRQKACLLAQQELSPEVKAFAIQFMQLSEYFNALEENLCSHISTMTLRIAQKILGESIHLRLEDLEPFNLELKNQMRWFYRLRLILSPDDKNNLLELLAREIPKWRETSTIPALEEDVRRESGSLQIERDSQSPFLNDILSKSLAGILAEASKK